MNDCHDNTVSVVQQLIKHYNLPVSKETIKDSLRFHPEYPSLKSICDALSDWKIDNYPMRLDREELIDIGSPFIAHLNGAVEKLVFVPELNDNSTVKYFDTIGKSKTEKSEDFFEKYSGVSLIIDPDESAGEDGYTEKKQADILHRGLPYLAGFTFILFTSHSILLYDDQLNNLLLYAALLLTKLIGLGFSFLLISKDLNIESNLANTLCGFIKKTNCNSLLNTDASKVFGWLHWSDIGLIYFLSGLLVMISIPGESDYNLISVISFGALGYVLYSIYYQVVVSKTWCPLCLGVQAILVSEAALYYKYLFPLDLSWISIFKYLSITLTIVFGVVLYKIYHINKQTSQQERSAYLKFRRNPIVFHNLLFQGRQIDINISNEVFVVGKPDATVTVTVFLSLNCSPCQMIFNQLKMLFKKEDAKFNLIFSFYNQDKFFVNQVSQLFEEKKQKDAAELLITWYNASDNERASLLKDAKTSKSNDRFEKIQKIHRELFTSAEIKGTPKVFVNGYELPGEYQIKDIYHFIEDLKKRGKNNDIWI